MLMGMITEAEYEPGCAGARFEKSFVFEATWLWEGRGITSWMDINIAGGEKALRLK